MQTVFKQYEVLNWASLFLEKYQRETRVAELLLQHHLGVTRTKFYTTMQDIVPANVLSVFEDDLFQHATTGVPIQHLIGTESFFGRDFLVNQDVLIPRPETEELVLQVINHAKERIKNTPPTIVDVGTGSGVIAVTLALEIPGATVYATDISDEALVVAKQNAMVHQADVIFLQGNYLQPVREVQLQVDLIVSNPPYISETEKKNLADTVIDFDPALALFAEENGLAAYKEIISQLPNDLTESGAVFFEIGYQQGEVVCELLKERFPNSEPVIVKDINKNDRIVICK